MAPLALPVVKVTVVPEGALPLEPAAALEGVLELEELLPPPPLDEDELLDEDDPPPPLEELLELEELLPPELPPLLLLELELLELPPPPLELELLLEEEDPPLLELEPPLLELELLELDPPLPPEPESLLAAGRQPDPVASNPAKHRVAKPVPAFRRNRPKVTFFIMMPSLVPGGSRLNQTKCESGVLEPTRWSGGI